ncbi:MAG: hypothetical protein ACYTXC_24575 [Nostoc sp.]
MKVRNRTPVASTGGKYAQRWLVYTRLYPPTWVKNLNFFLDFVCVAANCIRPGSKLRLCLYDRCGWAIYFVLEDDQGEISMTNSQPERGF